MSATNKQRRRPNEAKKSHLGLWAGLAVGLLLLSYVGVVANSRPRVSGDRLRLDEFVTLAGNGALRSGRILDQDQFVVGGYERRDGSVARYNVPFSGGGHNSVEDLLIDNRVPTEVDHQFSKRLMGPVTLILPALIIVVVFAYLTLSYRRGSGLFSVRSGAQRFGVDDSGTVTFADVAGQEAAITELREVKDFLSDPGRFSAVGAQVPKGILLFGPPGCGKTLLARAVAGESGASFFSISGSDFVEVFVGVGAARVRDLFREAREHAPAIVFIDELDSVGRRRGGRAGEAAGGQGEQEQALNQILAEMDGFSPLEGILVIGATNRPDILDPALLRPGRFDRTIALERPDEASRLAILTRHAAGKPIDPAADLAAVARRAVGLSGADLASVTNEAALLAARSGSSTITQAELDLALERILEAPERQRRLSQRARGFARAGGGGPDKVGFGDVGGADEAIAELQEVRDYLAEPDRYAAMGARPPKGFLLVGPPGCGKTLLARAVAAESNAAFFSVAATEFVEVFVGEGAGRVRDLFAEARAAAPSIVFIDELDAVGARRSGSAHGGREHDQTLNQILVELDGFDARAGVTVLAATNRPDILDPALIRPGRFDRRVHLDLPDRAARRDILALHARNLPLTAAVELGEIAAMTQGYSGAELANLLNEATLLATRAHRDEVSMGDVREGFARVRLGLSRAIVLTADDRLRVAYHEMGHALVGLALPGAQRPHMVSVVARGRSLGVTWQSESVDRLLHSRSAMIDQMGALLAGRVAEQLVFGEPASTSGDDLRQVTDLAQRMVCDWGMGELLPSRHYPDGAGAGAGEGPRSSEAQTQAIEDEVGRLVSEAQRRAHGVLSASRGALDTAARALVERESISAAELRVLIGAPQAASIVVISDAFA